MNGMSQTTTYTEGLRAQDGRQQKKIEQSQENYCAEIWTGDEGRAEKRISNTEKDRAENYRAEGSVSLQSWRICQDEVRVNSGITEVSQ